MGASAPSSEEPLISDTPVEPGPPLWQGEPKPEGDYHLGSHSKYPRISRPVELIRHSYDVVVVGSGYGGGIAASRMARAGQKVCVLERGKERWPGEYPSNIAEAGPEVSVSGLFAPHDQKGVQVQLGDPTKLYHLVVGQGQNAFVASGLGGTSLLNANVFLEADPGTMSLPEWPEDLQGGGGLQKYYERARGMLQPESYPEHFPLLPKLELLRKQAKLLGLEKDFYRVPQTTRFENGPNVVGVQMQASTLTGMDCTGVNDGSKSSTLVNYLSDAWNWGAEIFCECEVKYFKKHPTEEGWLIFYAWHGGKRGLFRDSIYHDLMWVHAKKCLFLGAGTLGTTEILLKSGKLGIPMSDRVGTSMSGNGDILAFGYDTNEIAQGMGQSFPEPSRPVGPTITGVIDCRDQPNALDGFVIQEGAIPEALVGVLQAMLEIMPGKISPEGITIIDRLRQLADRSLSRFYRYAPRGSLEKTQTYLIMSHDSNQAIMRLVEGKPVLTFLGVGNSVHVEHLNGILAKATNAIGGTFINSPFFAALGKQEITVHPIGGAIIASDGTADTGATSQYGELLTGSGKEVHAGVVVVDGSMVPTALGVNPLATISALAERSVEAAALRMKMKIDFDTRNGLLDLFATPLRHRALYPETSNTEQETKTADEEAKLGIGFAQVMSGYIYPGGDITDFTEAADAAHGDGAAARFFLSFRAWDTNALLERDDHPATLTGTFTYGTLPGSPFMVLQGDLKYFATDSRTPDTTNQTYDFDMISTRGEIIHFNGYKIIDRSIAFSPLETWKAASTLYVTLTKPDKSVVGRGILHTPLPAFVSEVSTFTTYGPNALSKLRSAAQFFNFYISQIAADFFGPLGRLQWPVNTYRGYIADKTIPTETISIYASDTVSATLQHWVSRPNKARPSQTVLFISGIAVDHQVFALPTIEQNAVEFFQDAGYDVFCVTHRVGKTPVAQQGYSTFDARQDIKAAFQRIHEIKQSTAPIYVIAHCVGSIALSMALLDGTVPGKWISGITASQVFFNPIFGLLNQIKGSLPLPITKIYQTLAGSWFSCISSTQDSLVQRFLNQVVRFYPVEGVSEICNSVACHRSELALGRLWSHKKLNSATHSNVSNFLGGVSMNALEHLMYMGTHGDVVNNNKESLRTPENLQRLQGIRILFISGSENVVFKPQNTDVSYTLLRTTFGRGNYERRVFDNYGHLDCWMGADAARDVYPHVLAHAKKISLST